MELCKLSVEDLCELLDDHSASSDVLEAFRSNGVTGEVFEALTEEEVKELAPKIADRVTVRKIRAKYQRSDPTAKQVETGDSQATPIQLPKSVPQEKEVASPNVLQDKTNTTQNTTNSNWHRSFVVPQFPPIVCHGIQTGELTSRVRQNIIQTLGVVITQHTFYPTKEQYNTVLYKLLETHPTLADEVGKGSGSWRIALRNHLKYPRQQAKEENATVSGSMSHPTKKKKATARFDGAINMAERSSSEEEEYQTNLKKLKTKWEKKKRSSKSIRELMDATYGGRRDWILNHEPPVSEVLDMFPPLTVHDMLRREFKAITGTQGNPLTLLEGWPKWCEKIVKYSRLEQRNRVTLKKLIMALDDENTDEYTTGNVCIDLLHELLLQKGKKGEKMMYSLPDTADLEEEAVHNYPFIFRTESAEQCQYHIMVERELLIISDDLELLLIFLVLTMSSI